MIAMGLPPCQRVERDPPASRTPRVREAGSTLKAIDGVRDKPTGRSQDATESGGFTAVDQGRMSKQSKLRGAAP